MGPQVGATAVGGEREVVVEPDVETGGARLALRGFL
jgi:hypothetical protein